MQKDKLSGKWYHHNCRRVGQTGDFIHLFCTHYLCDSVAEWWFWGRTCDQQVAGSNPVRRAAECKPGKLVYTHVPLSPSSIIWYLPMADETKTWTWFLNRQHYWRQTTIQFEFLPIQSIAILWSFHDFLIVATCTRRRVQIYLLTYLLTCQQTWVNYTEKSSIKLQYYYGRRKSIT